MRQSAWISTRYTHTITEVKGIKPSSGRTGCNAALSYAFFYFAPSVAASIQH